MNSEKEPKEQTLNNEEILSSIFRTAPIGIGIISNRHLKLINDRFCEMLGYTREEIIGKDVRFLYPDEKEYEYVGREKYSQIKEHGTGTVETRWVRKDGMIIDVLLSSTPMDISNINENVTFTAQDISERKQHEELVRIQLDLGEALSKVQGLDETLHIFIKSALQVSKMDCGGVYLVDENIGELNLACHKGLSKEFVESRKHYDANHRNTKLIMLGKPVYTHHSKLAISDDEKKIYEGLQAIAIIPILRNGRVIACLNIASHSMDDISEFSRNALETIASRIGEWILRARMEEVLWVTQSYMDSSKVGFCRTTSDGHFEYINEAAAKNLGYTREEMSKLSVFDIDVNFQKEAWPDFWKELREKKHLCFETVQKRKDGTTCPMEVTTNFLEFNGREYGFAFGVNISEREQHKELVRVQRDLGVALSGVQGLDETLHIFIESALCISGMDCGGVYLVDENSGELNLAYHLGLPEPFVESVKHYPADHIRTELIMSRKPIYTHYQQMDIPAEENKFWKKLRAIAIIPVLRNDKVIASLNIASHSFDDVPEFVRNALETIASRIGEWILRARMEDTLRIMQFSADVADMGLFRVTSKGNFDYVNESALKKLGYTREEMLKMSVFDIDSNYPEDIWLDHWKSLKEKKSLRFETVHLRKDGSTYPAEMTTHYLEFNGREYEFAFCMDITERKNDERDRKKLEEQLRQSQKMEAIGQLAGGVAHDFNNQLVAIMGCADILRYEMKDDKNIDLVETILTASENSAELIQQLLAYARKGKNLSVSVDVNKIIVDVISLMKHSVDKRISLQHDLDPSTKHVLGDPAQIENVLLNIGLNSRDAIQKDGEIKFETQVVELDEKYCRKQPWHMEPGTYLQVSVSDTGRGMDKETQKHIFEPFFTTKDMGKGTGMGLAAVYGIIKNHNGAVNVYSELDKGTVFKIFFPIAEETEFQDDKSESIQQSADDIHVLIVDDDEIVRTTASIMLEELGYRVDTCVDGDDAIQWYRENWRENNLIILDMIMPKLNGKEAFLALREINPDALILLSSGYNLSDDTQAVIDLGAVGFIQKPFKMNDLSQQIAETLAKR